MDWKLATEPGLPVIAAPGETVPEAHVTEPIKDNVRNDVRGNDDESDDASFQFTQSQAHEY